MTIQLGKVQLIPGGVMKRPGKTNLARFSSTNKKMLTGPFLQIKITKIDNFASFLTGTQKKNV